MDTRLLEELVRLMAANDLNTVDVRDGDKRVILKRGPAAMHFAPSMHAPLMHGPAAPTSTHASAGPSTGMEAAAAAGAAEDSLLQIKSPMVGTYYAAPKQGEKPFVSVGSTVEEETDVCIIEAMKVFNNIKAECRGTIMRMLIQDGQPVEHGTLLFLVKPA